ncbi:MAG TPA: HNH endonuclease signature motif containing protein [Candidatus Angelobacter sp.]|nr:HNH endonuclease signature motif containing protein [Candidatus Angelobacter sp.]
MKANKSREVRQGRTANPAKARPLQTMKCKQPNAEPIWKQIDDLLVPRLRLGPIDRAAYSFLLRHSRLEGKLRLRFSIPWLARGIRLSGSPTRLAVRRLVSNGALRLVARSKAGHVVEVRLPEEILADHPEELPPCQAVPAPLGLNLEEENFLRTTALRHSIHAREGGRCFYCLGRLSHSIKCLDHVVPSAQMGQNSYRNLVSCCLECNVRKGPCRADDFLRSLFRDRQLTAAELAGRLRALDALASGKLRPPLPSPAPPQTRLTAAPQPRARAVSSSTSKTP